MQEMYKTPCEDRVSTKSKEFRGMLRILSGIASQCFFEMQDRAASKLIKLKDPRIHAVNSSQICFDLGV